MSAFKALNKFSLIKVSRLFILILQTNISFFHKSKSVIFNFDNAIFFFHLVLENYVDILTKPKDWKEDNNYDDIAASLYTIIYSCYLDRKPLQEEKVPKLIYILDGINSSK